MHPLSHERVVMRRCPSSSGRWAASARRRWRERPGRAIGRGGLPPGRRPPLHASLCGRSCVNAGPGSAGSRRPVRRGPGPPDIAFPGRRKAIWVRGCSWHRHRGRPRATLPKSRRDFWIPKLAAKSATRSGRPGGGGGGGGGGGLGLGHSCGLGVRATGAHPSGSTPQSVSGRLSTYSADGGARCGSRRNVNRGCSGR